MLPPLLQKAPHFQQSGNRDIGDSVRAQAQESQFWESPQAAQFVCSQCSRRCCRRHRTSSSPAIETSVTAFELKRKNRSFGNPPRPPNSSVVNAPAAVAESDKDSSAGQVL